MSLLTAPVSLSSVVTGRGDWLILDNSTDDAVTQFRYRLLDIDMEIAETGFTVDERFFRSGSLIARRSDRILQTASDLGLSLHAVRSKPDVATHNADAARVGLIHTWTSTPQDAGWWQFAFDKLELPYTYLSEQDLGVADLSQFDVLILPRTGSSFQQIVNGNSMTGEPTPWMPSEKYPNIGKIDQTEDTRKGMGYNGLAALQKFIEDGGVFITTGSSSAIPIDAGLTRRVNIRSTSSLQARGFLARTQVADSTSPIIYGYDSVKKGASSDGSKTTKTSAVPAGSTTFNDIPAYFSQTPVFSVNTNVGGYATPDWLKDATFTAEVPRTIVTFAKKDLNMSGMLQNPDELQGAPAVLDVPVGDGHVILFATRPIRRWKTQGNHALVWNVLLNWNDLRTGWPERKD